MSRALVRTIRTAESKSVMHGAIDELGDDDHAILIVAQPHDDDEGGRPVSLVWMNVGTWQAEGMVRYALRILYAPDEGEDH